MNKLKFTQTNIPIYAILFVLIIDLAFIITLHNKWNASIHKYIPLQEHIENSRISLSTGHLWLEEVIGGDKNINYEDNIYPYFNNLWVENRLFLQQYSKLFQTSQEKELIQEVSLLDDEFKTIYKKMENRRNNPKHKIGSDLDENFDETFNQLEEKLQKLGNKTTNLIYNELEKRNYYFTRVILLFIAINIMVFTFLFYARTKERKLYKELEHANGILDVIRNANQAIVKIKDKTLLLEHMVDILTTDEHIFNRAWIALYDENDKFNEIAGNDSSKEFLEFKSDLENSSLPKCLLPTDSKNILIIKDARELCKKCTLKHSYTDESAIVLRIEYDGKTHGMMSLCVKKEHLYSKQDHKLLLEIAGDIAFALHSLEIETKLIENEKNSSLLLNTIPNGVQKSDRNGLITYSNKAHHTIMGVCIGSLVGKYIWDFQVNNHSKEELREYLAYLLKEQPTPTPYITSNITMDGRDIILDISWNYERDDYGEITGFISIITDITEHEQIKRARLESEEQLMEAQSIAHIGSWVLTDSLNWSDEIYEIFEVEDRDSIHSYENFKNLIHPDDVMKVEEAFKDSIENKTAYQVTHRIITQKNQTIKYVQERCHHKFSSNGELIKSVGTIQDITELEQSRQELIHKDKIMIAQSRHAAMGEMISMIAHQWRQPVSVIAMGANNLLIDIELDTLNQKSIKTESRNILKQTEYLSKTIDDFRNFFRPDKEMEEVKLEAVIYEAQKIIGSDLENHNITLSVEYDKSYIVKTYSRELLQVYINLLKNAKEALIENRENNRNINIVISSDDTNLITTVCDNGGGIESDTIDKIFNPYCSTKSEKNGTGLGLYMSKTIIEKHIQGKIEAYNFEDGACFKISLPIKWSKL